VSADELRALGAEIPALRAALARERPDLVRKLRRALIEVGAEFTKVLGAPIELRPSDDEVGAAGDGQGPALLGEPWAPGRALARRLDAARVTLEDDSGAAALSAALAYHGRVVSLSQLRRRIGRSPPSLLDLAAQAEREGFSTHAARLDDPRRMARLELPLIAVLGHRFVLVHAVRGAVVHFFDPLGGLRRMRLRAVRPLFGGAVLLLRDASGFLKTLRDGDAPGRPGAQGAPPADRRGRAWSARLKFLRLLADSRGLLWAAGTLSLALLLLAIVAPKLSGVIVDQVLVHSDHGLLVVITAGMLLVNGAQFLLSGAKELCVAHLSALLDYRLSTLVYRQTLGIGAERHGRDRVGATLTRLAELQRVRDSISADLIDLVLQVAQGIVYLVMVFTYSWKLGAIALAAAPVAYLVVRIGGARLRAIYGLLFQQDTRSQSETTEQIESIATIKALSGAGQARERWEATLVDGVELQRRMLHASAGVATVLQTAQEIARYAGLYVAVRMVLDHELSPGDVLAVVQYLQGALRPLFVISGKLDELEQLGISFEKIDEVLAVPLEDEGQASAEPELEGNIVVRDLGFRYASDGPEILRQVSFEARRGQTVAIVGRSGSGKTTLARLLQGAMRPTSGEILFDEVEAAGIPLGGIRRNVGIVMQESHLFAGTILDNITYGDDRPDEARAREAARLAAAHEFITRFPSGYRTYLAEGGLGLSGGQRQRVCLARALYRDPRILVLDEATSSLDAESERAIMQNMRDILRGRTAIVIAHRLHTVKNADLILVLDQGRIVERGRHAELIGSRGLYHALFAQQFNQA
jgi:ATP-binding cassette, subfamily B, bacterial HlyB/CyaB